MRRGRGSAGVEIAQEAGERERGASALAQPEPKLP